MGLKETLKHTIFTDEEEHSGIAAQAKPASPIIGQPPQGPTSPTLTAVAPLAGVGETDSGVYDSILAGSRFEDTDSGKLIQKFLAPLSAISDSMMPPAVKFKTAVLQASAQSQTDASQVLAAFDKIETELQCMEQAFDAQAKQFTCDHIDSRNQRLTEIAKEIEKLQNEQSELSSEVLHNTAHAQKNASDFTIAMQRRRVELAQQKAQFEAYLKG